MPVLAKLSGVAESNNVTNNLVHQAEAQEEAEQQDEERTLMQPEPAVSQEHSGV